MQPKSARLFRRAFTWFFGVFLAISVLFSVIVAPLQSAWGTQIFLENFDAKNKGATVMTLDEWSDAFAGAFGLKALDLLSHNPNLMPSGRQIAIEVRDHILSGRHQLHLAAMLRNAWYIWPISCAVAYVYVVDGLITGHWTTAPEGPQLPY